MIFERELPDLFCFYDKVKRLAIVSFRNAMTEKTLKEAEDWLEAVQESSMLIEGILCDLKALRRFAEHLPFLGRKIPLAFLTSHPHQAAIIEKIVNSSSNSHKIAFTGGFQMVWEEAFRG